MSGWIKLYRSIQSHWLWESEKPFDKRSAWIDILLLVNHDDNKVFFDNEIVFVKRGEHITSEPKLSERWGWSRTKVRNFLKLLEQDGMIENKKEGRKRTRLIVLNYNDYQGLENNEKTRDDTTPKQEENKGETREEQEEDINKNDKNDKNSICMYSEKTKKIVGLLEDNIGVIPPILIEEVDKYSDIFDIEMFSEAIKIAANNKRRSVNYVLGILRNWKDNNILTIDDLEALRKEKEIERQEKQENQQKQKSQYPRAKKTRFHNFEQRTENYSNDDLEEIMRRKREEYFKKVREG